MNKRYHLIFPIIIVITFIELLNFDRNPIWYMIISLIVLLGLPWLVTKSDTICHNNVINEKQSYQTLDFARYIFAILIIILHMRPFFETNYFLDVFFNNIIGRIGVPFYFVITGFFLSKKENKNPNCIIKYIKDSLPLYITWSIIYIPLGLDYLNQLQLPLYLYPVGLILGMFYIGTYYHLWYFPALFISLLCVHFFKKHWHLKYLLIISFIFICLGATETYYGFLPPNFQELLSTYYFNIFYTTRNFLFFGLFYVSLGYSLGNKKITTTHPCIKLLLSFLLLVAEVYFVQTIVRLDSNILITCIPVTYYLFVSLIYSNPVKINTKIYRELNKYYYLLHPYIIFICEILIARFFFIQMPPFISLVIVLIVTHLLSILLIGIKKHSTLPF